MWVRIPPAAPFASIPWPICQASPPDPNACVDERGLGADYAYLLGLYLGDGMLTRVHRGVWRLRISLDARYLGIIGSCKAAIEEVAVRTPGQFLRIGCYEIYSNWKHWICVFPQHGPGPKHQRRIKLEEWQQRLVERHPAELLTGLIHSDGCRAINRVRRPLKGRVGVYEYPRYFFSNRSADIIEIFRSACSLIGVETRLNNWFSVSVATRSSVEILESFIGPKR